MPVHIVYTKPYSIPRCFKLSDESRQKLLNYKAEFPYGEIGALVFYRTYSQIKADGFNESINDVFIRVVDGLFSIKKHHMTINYLPWDEQAMQKRAFEMAMSGLRFEWAPAGRGLANCGTELMYKLGVAVLYNCAYTDLANPVEDLVWAEDASFCGVGVGMRLNATAEPVQPTSDQIEDFFIGDSRKAWNQATYRKLNEHLPNKEGNFGPRYRFNFTAIRARGQPLKTSHGKASGPEALRQLLIRIEAYFQMYYRFNKCTTDEERLQAFSQHVDDLAITDSIFYSDEVEDKLTEFLLQSKKRISEGETVLEAERWYELHTNEYLHSVLVANPFMLHHVKLSMTYPRLGSLYDLVTKVVAPPNPNEPIEKHPKPLPDILYHELKIDLDRSRQFQTLIPIDYTGQTDSSSMLQYWLQHGFQLDASLNSFFQPIKEHLDVSHYQDWNNVCNRPPKCLIYDKTRLFADIFNAIGKCVVAGGKRRTAQILLGQRDDMTFIGLKNWLINPERSSIMHSSNNSVSLEKKSDFLSIPEHAKLITKNGEPGFYNKLNVQRFGRVHHWKDPHAPKTREDEPDLADGVNPCGESPLERHEVCNLAAVILVVLLLMLHNIYQQNSGGSSSSSSSASSGITKRISQDHVFDKTLYQEVMNNIKLATEHATFYTQTVSLGKTHWPETNAVVARNRRTGVSMSGIPEARTILGPSGFRQLCRDMYSWVSAENIRAAKESGVPESIRKTVIKPDGTTSLVFGTCAGAHYPYAEYVIRRVRVASNHPVLAKVIEAGYHVEDSVNERNTKVVSFPLHYGQVRSADTISLSKQAALLVLLQQEFTDNAVSISLTFDPVTESEDVAEVIADLAPNVKSFSMFPRDNGAYKQMPIEAITKEIYESRCIGLKRIDWSDLSGGILEEPIFCTGDKCELPSKK